MDSVRTNLFPNCALCNASFKVTGYSTFGCRTPLLLHCGHSACEKCLKGAIITKDGFTCNICKAVTLTPPSFDIHHLTNTFPINYFLTGLWSTTSNKAKSHDIDSTIKYSRPKLSKKKEKQKEVICNECMSVGADSHCKECKAPYCGSCFNLVHSAARAFQKHNKIPLLSNYQHFDIEKPYLCKVHQDKKLEFYCNDCDTSLCSHCLFELHKDHSYILIDNVKTKFQTEFIKHYTKVTNILSRLNLSKKKAQEMIQSNIDVTLVNNLHQQIFETYSHIHGKLIVHENNMHLKVNMTDTNKHLEDLLEILTEAVNNTQMLLSSSSILLKDSSSPMTGAFISAVEDLKKKEDLPCYFLEAETKAEPSFRLNVDLIEKLEDMCTLDLTSAKKYRLVKESELPADYQITPIEDMTPEEIIKKIQASNPDPLPIDEQNDQVTDGASTSSTLSSTSTSKNFVPAGKYESLVFAEDLPIGCNIRVRLSHLVSPSEFHVQREGSQKKLNDFQGTINANNIALQIPPARFKKGCIYLAFYEPDHQWYRARIIEVLEGDKYRVLYIDYGNSEIINQEKLRTLPKSAYKFPILAYRCKLNNCVPRYGNEWDPAAVTFMAELIDNGSVLMHVIDKTQVSYVVDLYKLNLSQIINVQQALSFQEFSSYVPRNQIIPKEFVSSMKPSSITLAYQKINKGEIFDVHVCFVISPSIFFVQNVRSAKRLLRLSEEMQKYYNSCRLRANMIYDPVNGTVVAACYSKDKKWYRGIITDHMDSKQLQIFFIDLGTEELVEWKNVKVLQEKYYSLPVQAIKCSLCDIEPTDVENGWNTDAKSFFSKLIHNHKAKVVISSVKIKNDVQVVLYKNKEDKDICINALLVKENFAVSTGVNLAIVEYPKKLSEHPDQDCEVGVAKFKKHIISLPEEEIEKIETPKSSGIAKCDGTIRINVFVKRIVNPGEFYVRPSCFKDMFNQLESSMQKHYANLNESLEIEWNVDDRCVVKYDGTWYRAIILEILPEETSILKLSLPDEGLEIVTAKSSIRPLHKDFSTTNDGVIRCHLGGLMPPLDSWTQSAKAEFEDFVKNHSDSLYICQLGTIKELSLPVQLFARVFKDAGPLEPNRIEWKSLNHYLRIIGQAKSDSMVQWDFDGNILNWNDLGCNKENSDEAILGKLFSSSLSISDSVDTTCATSFQGPSPDPEEAVAPASWTPAPPLKSLSFICTPTFVDSDCNIYLYNFHESTPILEHISNAFGLKLENSPPLPYDSRIKVGDICVAKFHIDNKWYRAVLLEIKEEYDECVIQFVDYGNIEECKLSELQAATITHNIPIQTVKCCFYNIIPTTTTGKWTEKQIESIQYTIVDKHCRINLCKLPDTDVYGIEELKLPDGTNLIAELVKNKYARYKKEMPLNISDLVNESTADSEMLLPLIPVEVTKKEISIPEKEVCQTNSETTIEKFFHWTNILKNIPQEFQPTLQYHELQIPEAVDALVVDATAFFSATNLILHLEDVQEDPNIIEKIEEFKKLSKTLQEEGPSQPTITRPCIGKACCAKFSVDNQWYRAFVLSEPSDEDQELRVQFVDYGNVELIPIECVRTLKEEWAKLEVFGLFSQLYNIRVSEEVKDLKDVTEILSSQGSYTAIIKKRSPCLQVDLYLDDVLAYEQLIESGLLIQS